MTGRTLHLDPDLQIRITPTANGRLDLRLHRRPVSAVGADDFAVTPIGFSIPAHRAGDLADALREVAAELVATAGRPIT